MSNLSISSKIEPGETVTFRLETEFYGYGVTSRDMSFIAPKACPQINKVDGVTFKSKIVNQKKVNPKAFTFTKYARPSDNRIDKNNYRLKFTLSSAKASGDLKPGDRVLLTSADPKLAQLNGISFTILTSTNNSSRSIITLKVNNSRKPTVLPSSAAAGTFNEIDRVVKVQQFTVQIPKVVYENLVTEVAVGPPRIGDVEDLVIFTFRRYDEDSDATIKRKLMNNGDVVNEQNPPSRSAVIEFRNKDSFIREFDIDEERNIEFYVTVARYTYTKDGWSGEWLQVNQAGNTIWKRAKKA